MGIRAALGIDIAHDLTDRAKSICCATCWGNETISTFAFDAIGNGFAGNLLATELGAIKDSVEGANQWRTPYSTRGEQDLDRKITNARRMNNWEKMRKQPGKSLSMNKRYNSPMRSIQNNRKAENSEFMRERSILGIPLKFFCCNHLFDYFYIAIILGWCFLSLRFENLQFKKNLNVPSYDLYIFSSVVFLGVFIFFAKKLDVILIHKTISYVLKWTALIIIICLLYSLNICMSIGEFKVSIVLGLDLWLYYKFVSLPCKIKTNTTDLGMANTISSPIQGKTWKKRKKTFNPNLIPLAGAVLVFILLVYGVPAWLLIASYIIVFGIFWAKTHTKH